MLVRVGLLLCLVSAACFGALAIFGKLAYGAGVSTETLVLARFTLAAVLLGAWSLFRSALRREQGRRRHRLPASLVLTALALGGIGYATQATLYFTALDRLDASLLSLIFYTYPLFVTVGAVLLGRTRLTAGRVAALGAALGGTGLVLAGAGDVGFDPLGIGLAFGTAATYTVYILVSDTVVHRISPTSLTTMIMIGAALTLAGRSVATGGPDLDFAPAGWWWLGCIAVVSTVLAALLFVAGLRRTGASTAAILSTFEPVVTTVLAALFLQEILTPVQLLGGAAIVSSVVLLNLWPRRADDYGTSGARQTANPSAKVLVHGSSIFSSVRRIPVLSGSASATTSAKPRSRANLTRWRSSA